MSLLLRCLCAVQFVGTLSLPSWVDSTNTTHTFLVGGITDDAIREHAPAIDFVWGANASQIPLWRAANPATILGFYMKFTRDVVNNLTWWQAHHPSWVLYTCDRVTTSASRARPRATRPCRSI